MERFNLILSLLAITINLKYVFSANVGPTLTGSTSLDSGVCMELDGTNGADATFSFRPGSDSEFCDYKNVETLQIFQKYNSGTALPTSVRTKAYCVSRNVNMRGLLPGARCDHDYEGRSGRCSGSKYGDRYGDKRCLGQWNDQTGLADEDGEKEYYCYTNGTTSQTCQKTIMPGETCSEGTDICQAGYLGADINSAGSMGVQYFSQVDGTSSSQKNACKGGYLTSGNVGYSLSDVADTAGSASLASPYSCDISSGITSGKAFDGSGATVSNTIPGMGAHTTDTTQGYCAWSGKSSDYLDYFDSLRKALLASDKCNYKAYSWVLSNNLLSSSFFSSTIDSGDDFANWYAGINNPDYINDMLSILRKTLGYPTKGSTAYQQCMYHHSLDVFNPKHWGPITSRCLASSLTVTLSLLGFVILFVLF